MITLVKLILLRQNIASDLTLGTDDNITLNASAGVRRVLLVMRLMSAAQALLHLLMELVINCYGKSVQMQLIVEDFTTGN